MRVGFTGTQTGMTNDQLLQVHMLLGDLFEPQRSNQASHGMCEGADVQFHSMAEALHYRTLGHPGVTRTGHPFKRGVCYPDRVLPARPFLDRNTDIVRESEVMIATPKEMQEERRSGTWATIRFARKLHRPLVIVYPDGTGTIEHVPGCETLEQYRQMVLQGVSVDPTFERELETLINRHSKENGSNTPDFLLAQYLVGCLNVWNDVVTLREKWYGRTGTSPATIEQQEMLNRKDAK